MNIIIKAHNVKVTDSLKEYALEKIEKMDRYFENIQSITIDLDIESISDESKSNIASATVYASGTVLRARCAASTLYASIDLLHDKLLIQLRRYKGRLKDHKHKSSARTLFEVKTSQSDQSAKVMQDDDTPHMAKKPIDPQEAASILDQESLGFYVFRSSETERICIIYPSENENEFNLIET